MNTSPVDNMIPIEMFDLIRNFFQMLIENNRHPTLAKRLIYGFNYPHFPNIYSQNTNVYLKTDHVENNPL